MGFLEIMAGEISQDLSALNDDVSDATGLTVRLQSRVLRNESWKNRLRAAQNAYALVSSTAHLLSPVEAPTLIEEFTKAYEVIGNESQERAEVSFVLQECQDAISTDLSKFTDALQTYYSGNVGTLGTPGGADHASVILNVLNTLCQMLGHDEYPTRSAESEHQAHRLKMHASSNIYHCRIPDTSSNVITFDNLPIGNGSVEILENGVRRGFWSRLTEDPANVRILVHSDSFQWRFKFESEEVMNAVHDHEDAADRINKGYRFVVRPVWDTDDKDTIMARRNLVLSKPGFVELLTTLHSSSKGLGPSGAKVQSEVDIKVVMLLSFLAQRGSEPPHAAIISDSKVERVIFRIMFDLLKARPSIEQQAGVGGKKRMPLDRTHIAVARFYHGISSSEEGRQHFAYHQDAIMKIVDIANNNTQGAGKPDCAPPSHEALCYDGNYIIRCLTNFSNKPSKWTLTTSLNLLRPKQQTGWMCEFARGEVIWTLSLHIFLMDEHRGDMPALIFYKGTSFSEVQLAVGIAHATAVATENKVIPGCHPIVIRYTHDGRLKSIVIPNKHLEIYRWAHLVVSVESSGLTVIMNGEIIYTHSLPCELMVNFQAGHQDTFLGAPPWEYGRSSTASAWVYHLMLIAGTALETQQARKTKGQDELKAWIDNGTDMTHFDYSRLAQPGVDDLPDPVHLPGIPVQIFDPRLKVASEEGIDVLCDLLNDPLESQKQAAGQALRNLADPAVVTNMKRVVSVLLKPLEDAETGQVFSKMHNVYKVMLEAREAPTFEAVAELATNLLTWIPPPGEMGIDNEARLELIKHIVKQHPDANVTEARAPIVVHQLLMLIHFPENVKCLADPSVAAMNTFFRFLTSSFTTVTRTQDLLIKLLAGPLPEVRQQWAEEICQGDKFQRFMQQLIRRKDDRRISSQYRVLMNFVLQQCNQRKLMGTLSAIRDDDLSNDELYLVAQVLYSCLSTVPSSVSTKAIQSPKPLKKARSLDGLGQILKLRVPGAPSMFVRAIPQIGRQIGEAVLGATSLIEWNEEPILVDPNEIIIWVAKTESALQQPIHKREECKMILAHTRPLRMELAETEAQKAQDNAYFKDRYRHETNEPLEVFQLDFQDTVYYQLQFMSGKQLDPYLEKDDIEMVADEAPRVVLQGLTEGMVSQDSGAEDRCKANTAYAFEKAVGRSESIIEYILRLVESIEARLRKELEDDKQDEENETDTEKSEALAKEDPTSILEFMNRLLKWTRIAKATRSLEALGDGQVAAGGQDIDAAETKNDEDRTNVVASMSYVRLNDQLRPTQRILALAVVAVAMKQPHKLTESIGRILNLVDSLDSTVAQCMCDSMLQLLSIPRNIAKFSRANVEKVLSSMTQAFFQPEKAEASLLSFCNILTKWLKPEAKDIADSKEPASSRIISPLLAILQKPETSQEQRSFIFNIIRQGMRYEIISAVSFTSGSATSTTSRKTKGGAQQLLQVLRPLERSVDRLSSLENYHELFRDLSVAFSSASVLKKVCLVSNPKAHAMLILEDVVPKLMRVIGEIKDFLPRFKDATAFQLDIPSICIDSQTRKVIANKYLLLPYVFNARLFRELCGAISNVGQCLSNLQSDLLDNTNCVPILQLLAYDLGDGLRDLYNMLKEVEVDIGTKNMSLLDNVDTDMSLLIDAMSHIVHVCNRKMHARVVEVMYTLLHSWGPQMPRLECKKQDVMKATHDYRIVSQILTKSNESRGQTQTVYLDSRNERAFTFSLWAKTDKDVMVDLRISWDCFSKSMSQAELAKAVKNGEDKLPIEASLKLLRRQGDMAFYVRYSEERSTDDYKYKRMRIWDWRDKNDQTIKNILNHKGWAYFAFTLSITEQRIRGEMKKSQDPTTRLQMKFHDTQATAELGILCCIRQSKPLQTIRLEMTKADEQYDVLHQTGDDELSQSNVTAQQTQGLTGQTQTGLSTTSSASNILGMKSSGTLGMKSSALSGEGDVARSAVGRSEGKSSFFSSGSGPSHVDGNKSNVGNESQEASKRLVNPFDDPLHPFEKAQLENFMAVLLPFEVHDGAVHGLLQIAPSDYSPEQRAQVMSSITMPDVFLQHNLIPLLVPMCGGHASEQLTKWACNTLYLMLMAFARPVPAGLTEEVEAMKAHRNFEGLLQRFLQTCQLGDPAENLGGVRVLMDVFWKLFTRRKRFIPAEDYFNSLLPEVAINLPADNFYHVPFLGSIVHVLTALCIGRDNRAVRVTQDFIAKELLKTNEAAASRRRPEPESYDNYWATHSITAQNTQNTQNNQNQNTVRKKSLVELFEEKDRFVLLAIGTCVFFDPHDPDLEAKEGVKIPRVLWNQDRAQPPRYACGQHSDDVTQRVGDKVSLERFLYFALINLLAHLCADRHTANAELLSKYITDNVVRSQLVQQETLMNAGLRFIPPGELLQNALSDPHVEARDLGDISDLAGLAAHTSLLLYAYLGQPPFSDERRSTVIKSVYLDGRRADDDDTVYDDAGSNLTLSSKPLQDLCHMCSWQLASLADLCDNMCSFNGKPMPKPPQAFTDAMSALISALSKMLSKLIGLGYFERFRMDHSKSSKVMTQESANIYKIDHLVSIFTLMHKLQRTHRSVTSALFLAGLTDVCKVINQCCALSVNENILQFMTGFLEFIPPSSRSKVGESIQLPVDEKLPARKIAAKEMAKCESIHRVLADLGKPSLPWEAEHVSVSEAARNLAEFVTVLLDFVSLPDARLAIQAVRLLARLCCRRKDFLHAVDSLELLDMDDAEKFNALEVWVKETDRVIDRINHLERDLHEQQLLGEREGLEHYAHQFENNEWNEDDSQSRHIDIKDRADRLIEYADKHQAHQQVVRMAATNLQGDARILNFDFDVKSLPKRDAQEEGDSQICPLFIGVLSSAYIPAKEDNDDVKMNRFKPPSEFFGCDETGSLYIRGQTIGDNFGGFQQGSCVGIELDYTGANPKLFIYVDGFRTACIDREVEESSVPCVVFGSLQQQVKLNQGRPRRGKGILISGKDTKLDENSLVVDIMYDVLRDVYCIKSPVDEEATMIYSGWNSCASTSSLDFRTEYLEKLKAFKLPIAPKKSTTWCINVTLTQAFIESAQFVRGAHVASQKAFNSFYTNTTTHLRRMVGVEWNPVMKKEEENTTDTGLVSIDIHEDMVYGATRLFVCFNEEDPSQLTPEQDAEITLRLRLTQLYPVREEKAQLAKLFNHFTSICKQGDGHLLKYHRVELLALRVLSFLRSSAPLRDSIMAEKTLLRKDSAFDVAVKFLQTFTALLPMYRNIFVRPDVFRFLVKSLAYEDMGISGLLVNVYLNNPDASERLTPSFVREMMEVLKENLTARPMVSLDALRVLNAVVAVGKDIESRNNGNVVAMEFLKENTVFRLESPFIAMARDGFLSAKINLKDNRDKIKGYLEALETRAQKRQLLKSGGQGQREFQDDMQSGDDGNDLKMDPFGQVSKLELGTQRMFPTTFALSSIELMLKCSAFGANRTVLKHFAREVIKCQRPEMEEGGEEDEDDDHESQYGMARQRYFRHVVYWLASDSDQEIPLVVQDAYLRMVCILLQPHEIEDMLHDRWDARAQRLRLTPEKPTHIVLLLIQWFTQYLRRFPELHVFSPRISPVVEAIDMQITFTVTPYFVRDHLFLLLLQVLKAYDEQNTWKRWWSKNFLVSGAAPAEFGLGGPADQPPGAEKVTQDFDYMVTNGCFEGQPPKALEPGQEAVPEENDEIQDGPDILTQLWVVLFDQSEWCHREWQIGEEMCVCIQQILDLGLCDTEQRNQAYALLQRIGPETASMTKKSLNALATWAPEIQQSDLLNAVNSHLQRPWWPQNQADDKDDHFEEKELEVVVEDPDDQEAHQSAASGLGYSSEYLDANTAGDDFGELWKVTATRLGRHARVSAQDRQHHKQHAQPFKSLTSQDDPVMPRGLRMPPTAKVAREEEDLKDFMYELVELDDAKLAANLRIDVNLWRRQQLTHPSFELYGTDEKTWNIHQALRESLQSLGMKLFFEENVLMEIMMEIHVTIDIRDIKEALFGQSKDTETEKDKDSAMNQVFFEVEVKRHHSPDTPESGDSEIIFLENFSYILGRKKLVLQVLGADSITMRSRCLFDARGIKVTVANPRLVALTSPTSFDAEVIQRVVNVGAGHHALSNEPGDGNSEGELLVKGAKGALESITEKKKISRKVIHEMMPRYRNILVDIVEERCFGHTGGVNGLDHVRLQRILEAEHQQVVAMINRACSYVMLEHLLTKLDIDRKDWELQVQQTFPNLTRVFETLSEDAFDEMTDSEVPLILYREPEDERMETLRSWILRICHVVRSVAFTNQPRLSFSEDGAKIETEGEENIFEQLFDDTGEMLLARACCASLLNILQEIFTHQEEVEEEWKRWTPAQQVSHQFLKSFVVEKAIFFCPFSIDRDLKRKVRLRLLRFFEDAQVEATDPLRLVPEMLYHPDVWLRLEALKLGCNLLEDADLSLQAAFQQFDFPQLNLQKALAYQFSDFHSHEQHGEDDVQVIGVMLRKLQNLCEGHNSTLQAFVGEDLSIEGKDFATLMAEYLQKSEDDDDDDQDKNTSQNPTNLVEWICTLARQTVEQMKADQQWQVSMKGAETKYSMLKQLFDTAAEIVQGPNRGNQGLLLESEILLDVNQLWLRQRIDEFTFRALLQDNEDLFESFMKLLESMRLCEISVLKFLMSLLEEEELDPEDPNFREVSEELVEHKGTTIRRMVEELNPKIICDKVITHWNICPEARDPIHAISPIQDDDEIIENDTAEPIIRTKGEKESSDYDLEAQEEHSLEICFLCWALFEGIQQSPEFGNRALFEGTLDRKAKHPNLHSRNQWATSKSKIYDTFNEAVTKMHHSKYLHFLFGRVEIIRGSRLQKLFFLVPKAIRSLKAQSLIKDWQEGCINSVDRSGPEAKLQDFSEQVRDEYIGFVEHQYSLSQKPFPLNASGEVMATARSAIVLLTIGITCAVAFLYDGSYSKEHKMGEYDVHYTKKWYVWVLTSLSTAHFVCAVLLVLFHIVAYSQWKIDTGLEQWKEDNPHSHHRLNGIFGPILMLWFFFQDSGLVSKLFLAATSFLGLHVDFLIYSLHLMYACAQVETLGKVFEALWITKDQVVGTAVLGFCVQYCFLVLGFLTFPKGYGFADMDTSQCSSLMECLLAHLDYGFRSGPVWKSAELSWWKFAFDYLYNLVVILILAAIISGIIIDTFANMRADLQEKNDDQQNNCFICGINRSTMERQMVKFEHHVFQEHYMWSYARFLMYLKQSKDSELNGPESYVKDKVLRQDYSFFPINRALSLDSDDEDYSERQVRIKDLEDMRGVVRSCSETSQHVLQLKREVKQVLKESNEAVSDMQKRLHLLSGDVAKKVQDAMLQKAAQEAQREK